MNYLAILLFIIGGCCAVFGLLAVSLDAFCAFQRWRLGRRSMATWHPPHVPYRDRNIYSIAEWRRKHTQRAYRASIRTYH